MAKEIIIVPGFYRHNSSDPNAKEQIIVRVLKEVDDRPGYWHLADGNVISDYELQESYTPVDFVASTKDKPKKLPPVSIFAGLGNADDVQEVQEVHEVHPIEVSTNIHNNQNFPNDLFKNNPSLDLSKQTPPLSSIPENFFQKEPVIDPDLDITLLERLNIDSINARREGIDFVKKQKIHLSFDVELNYDIEKLKQSIELLDLDAAKIAKYLMVKTISESTIEQLLQQEIVKILTEKLEKHSHNIDSIAVGKNLAEANQSLVGKPIELEKEEIPVVSIIVEERKPEDIQESIAEVDSIIAKYTQTII